LLLIQTIATASPAATAAFILAFCISLGLVLTKSWHGRFTLDGSEGVQKFHDAPTPRVGGLGIFLSLCVAAWMIQGETRSILIMIILTGIPAFLAGFVEDITKKVSPSWRLVATIFSGLLFAITTGAAVDLIETQWVTNGNIFLYAFAVVLIAVGIGGVANAINITDGFHGLAPGSLIIMYAAFVVLSLAVGDVHLALASMVLMSATAGFLLVNFPWGKIFLGDAGAYFSGFALAAIAVLITSRNEAISPLVAMLVIFYPIYETLFSIYRKRRREGHSPSQPDGVHMHMLVSRSLARPIAHALGRPHWKNALSGVLAWPFSFACAFMALALFESGHWSILGCLIFALLYGRIYRVLSLQQKPILRRHFMSDRPACEDAQ
jgi:UDP-N-acetylmuramyl pentapeptide phosphotransferase/UDP-N-acetylglucosamine-1-phosphate transferase